VGEGITPGARERSLRMAAGCQGGSPPTSAAFGGQKNVDKFELLADIATDLDLIG